MRGFLLLLLFVIGSAKSSASLVSEFDRFNLPPAEDLLKLGEVRIDGSLALSYDLGSVDCGSGIKFPIHMVHSLKSDLSRKMRSEFIVPDLEGNMVPQNAGRFLVRVFGGSEYEISAVPADGKYHPASPGILAKNSGGGNYSLQINKQWQWNFVNYRLESATGPQLLSILFEHQGGKLTKIVIQRFGGIVAEISVGRDDWGRPTTIQTPRSKTSFTYAESTGNLTQWQHRIGTSSTEFLCEYTSNLLSELKVNGRTNLTIQWAQIEEYTRLDSTEPAAAMISKINEVSYRYGKSRNGYEIEALGLQPAVTSKIVYNPKTGSIFHYRGPTLFRRFAFGVRESKGDYLKLKSVVDETTQERIEFRYKANGEPE